MKVVYIPLILQVQNRCDVLSLWIRSISEEDLNRVTRSFCPEAKSATARGQISRHDNIIRYAHILSHTYTVYRCCNIDAGYYHTYTYRKVEGLNWTNEIVIGLVDLVWYYSNTPATQLVTFTLFNKVITRLITPLRNSLFETKKYNLKI